MCASGKRFCVEFSESRAPFNTKRFSQQLSAGRGGAEGYAEEGSGRTRVSEIAEFDTESLATRTQGRGQLYYYGVLIKSLCVESNVRRMLSKTEIRSAAFGRTRRSPENGSLNCCEQDGSNEQNRQIKNETIFLDLNRALRASGLWSGIINMFQSEKKLCKNS